MLWKYSRGRQESNSQGRSLNVRLRRTLNDISGRPQDVRLRRPRDARSGRPCDNQIESLEDVQGREQSSDVLGTNICWLGSFLPLINNSVLLASACRAGACGGGVCYTGIWNLSVFDKNLSVKFPNLMLLVNLKYFVMKNDMQDSINIQSRRNQNVTSDDGF